MFSQSYLMYLQKLLRKRLTLQSITSIGAKYTGNCGSNLLGFVTVLLLLSVVFSLRSWLLPVNFWIFPFPTDTSLYSKNKGGINWPITKTVDSHFSAPFSTPYTKIDPILISSYFYFLQMVSMIAIPVFGARYPYPSRNPTRKHE